MSATEAESEAAFEAIIDADHFEAFLDVIDPVADECKIHLSGEGLRVTAVDPANVCMCRVTLDATAFESYSASGGVIGVGLARLEDVVGLADSGDLIHFRLDQATQKLDIEIAGIEYTLALIDPDSIRQEPDIPELELTATVVLDGGTLDRGISGATIAAGDNGHVRFRADPDAREFHIAAEGDTDHADYTLTDEDVLDASVDALADSLFSLDYVTDIQKPLGTDSEVEVRIGEELPTKWAFEIAEGHGEVEYLVAPRIQDGGGA